MKPDYKILIKPGSQPIARTKVGVRAYHCRSWVQVQRYSNSPVYFSFFSKGKKREKKIKFKYDCFCCFFIYFFRLKKSPEVT